MRLQDFCTALSTSTPYRHLVPLEAARSFPVPFKGNDGRLVLRFLLYTVQRDVEAQVVRVHRPFGRLSVLYPSGVWVEYVTLSALDPDWQDSVIGDYPHDAMKGLTLSEAQERRAELLAAIEEVLPWLYSTDLDDRARSAIARCLRLWQTVTGPVLADEYRALNPAFFTWLESEAGEQQNNSERLTRP